MEYMEYMLDKDINRQLRDVYNNSRFASMKDGIFKKPDSKKKNETYKTNAANCICACIDRIDSLVEHCNFLFDEDDSEYKLCDILNYGQTLLDCIAILAKLFEVPADKKTSSCFYELGLDGNGSDEEYFKYIRSLCSVHPVETSRHYNYQGDQSEWSPWIDVMKGTTSQVFRLLADDKQKADKADYAIIVYRNDLEYSKYVYGKRLIIGRIVNWSIILHNDWSKILQSYGGCNENNQNTRRTISDDHGLPQKRFFRLPMVQRA